MTENEAKRPRVAIVGGGRNVGRTLKAQIELLEELEAYRAIGTIEEFKALKEKSVAKKPRTIVDAMICPNCSKVYAVSTGNYCMNCGQKLDWE